MNSLKNILPFFRTSTGFRLHSILLLIALTSCNKLKETGSSSTLFTLLDAKKTSINFINKLESTEHLNTYTYRNFYNGAGAGTGDFNNDGLQDIYFCGNQVDNKLYLNKGNFIFEDITDRAGVSCHGSWSTGVSIADINGDGYVDIYVCKSGAPDDMNRHNQLFINNGDLTFSDRSEEYGLSILGLSNHASFFDYDHDGDLDCYLLSNSFQSVTEFDIKKDEREVRDSLGANRLFRNDNNHFTDVSREAGIYGSKIGFGLGVIPGDVNRDGWPDIYVANDFFERDYLYINNHNGTFTESLENQLGETSLGAMGADIADINNDGWPEIFVTEMTPEGNERLKTKVLFEDWDRYMMKTDKGYYRQFARNALQLNNKNGSFSEIGRFSGVSTTDWSWGALIADLDNDGFRDIFVANGIYRDLLDRDYLDVYSDASMMRTIIKTEQQAILKIIDMIPSVKIPNYAFHNNGDLTFTNLAEKWGLAEPSFSNGAAYGDLDNDGDLDLIVNNVNMAPFIYRNGTSEKKKDNFLVVSLKGKDKNPFATGASVTLYYNGIKNFQEVFPQRGFMSSVDNRPHFGLGSAAMIDSAEVIWPTGERSVKMNVKANQFISFSEDSANTNTTYLITKTSPQLFQKEEELPGLNFKHIENQFNDFDRDRLLFTMLSNEGPHMAKADVNGDGLEDIFICGAKDSPSVLYIQDKNGKFAKSNETLFKEDSISEDTDCLFFDADNDGDPDLYVASGGNEFPSSSSALNSRLYFNDGKGIFSKSGQLLPAGKYESSSCVEPADFDGDGDTDLFVGIRLIPFSYGLPANGYLLQNDGHGNFTDVSEKLAPALRNAGMITDMVWADIDNDSDPDMLIVGDWMPVKLLINDNGTFIDKSDSYGLAKTEGWWHRIIATDLNGDGKTDFVLGNHGLNSSLKASVSKPVTMYVNDFDMNGSIEQIICTYNGNKSFPLPMKDDIVKQLPSLESKYKKFDDYKNQTVNDMFPDDILRKSVILNARMLESIVLLNTGNGKFKISPLPAEAQFTPVYSILACDFDNDGKTDILTGGNQFRAKPENGIYAAGYGLFLKGKGDGAFVAPDAVSSGLSVRGEIRDMMFLNNRGKSTLVVARNNDKLEFFKY